MVDCRLLVILQGISIISELLTGHLGTTDVLTTVLNSEKVHFAVRFC